MIPDYPVGATFDIKFTTRAFATGAPTTAVSLAVAAYPNNSTTELTAGITTTFTGGFDGRAGLVNVNIVATTGNGYASGSTYYLVVTAGTVDSVSIVGEVVGAFTLERSAARVNIGAQGVAASTGDPGTSTTILAYLKQLVNVLIGTSGIATFPAEAAPDNAVSLAEVIRAIHADVTGLNGAAMRGTDNAALASVATEARLAELDAANLPTDIANVQSDTDNIQTRLPDVLVGGNIKADVLAISGSVSAADKLEEAAETVTTFTCAAGGDASTVIFSALDPASAINDQWIGQVLRFNETTTTTSLRGHETEIIDYDHATTTATVATMPASPVSGDTGTIG